MDWLNDMLINTTDSTSAPQWMIHFVDFRKRLFMQTFEPLIVAAFGPVEEEENASAINPHFSIEHRRLSLLPDYITNEYISESSYRATSMTFATLLVLYLTLSAVFLIFLSCFYHSQKTSPLFISPRRHRLPKLVPPPLPVEGYFSWVRVMLFLSDEEIINRIGYDSLIFLRFHRLALRCIVKMSLFSFVVLLPLNYTGSNVLDLHVGKILVTDFMRFTMANVSAGSPRLWVHCFAAYLLTGIVVRELLVEYETFNSIRHLYLLNREPHLRTVLVTNIPRHLRSPKKITNYFKHVYPDAVRSVFMCQNCTDLERLVQQRTAILASLEHELLLLCRNEKKKLYEPSMWKKFLATLPSRLEECGVAEGTQERLVRLYSQLEELNNEIEREQRRRSRVMKMLDKMEAGEGANDIDYVLASPFVTDDPKQRRLLGLSQKNAPATIEEGNEGQADEVDTSAMYSVLPDENVVSRLRSRSPADLEMESKGIYTGQPESSKKAKVNSLANAKQALKRYGRFNKDMSFLGRPILSTGESTNQDKIEDHINEVTDKAFVVMRTFTAATVAIQSMHSSKPGSMQVTTAPEPRDVLWENIYVSKGAHRTRSILGDFLVYLIICFYVVPVAIVSMFVSEKALVTSSPRLAQLHGASALFSAGIQMVQPLCIVGLQQLQPPLFMAIGRMEGMTSYSEVQMRAFSRYFFFQVLNVFLVTTISSTIFDTVALIVVNPESAFLRLGNALPHLSSFFITFVTIKTFLGLGMELVRLVALLQAAARYIVFPSATLRARRDPFLGCRSIDDPGWFPFHKILAQDMLVVVISVVFAVIAPLVLLPCILFCLFSRIMWTHHHLYVYESVFESGGQFWPKIFRRFVFGLVIAQMTITGQFILKGAKHEAYATIFLIFLTYTFLRSTRARYDATSSTLPLEVATVMDISLQHEEQQQNTNARDPRSPRQAGDPGTLIGCHDPFRNAYLQPCLRSNPRARPEQPFPPAQLGSPDGAPTETISDDGEIVYHDSGATVRLKSMNQQERKLINRWWDDQLQSAGPQNLFWILAGEECGTLTLSGSSLADANIHGASTLQSHSFV
ncbi:hypothetical protein FisN_24Hh213 [Fistulifera solaris]|uniref:CSC1/OSCA1-like 7TM region domain-containing protein n=1 Tax=Fistulifera solaris TaxID=1519565 RepID=A0A1Z5JV61_FISSO|nr:hypothetical protein FisN_24Hh213 [Fistulifera solaris]|eukprot:GAX17722.1 hypothetical protein FisN_24Hh213 [Fistulifera solaris]